MKDGGQEGMQHFDGELEKLIRAGTVDLETGLGYASNPGNLRLQLTDFIDEQAAAQAAAQAAEQASAQPEDQSAEKVATE
jgi:twitching motility protein PilT